MGKLQLIVPAKLRQDILRSLHEGTLSAHLGEENMRNRLKERFYWPSCADDVSEWCSCCAVSCSRCSQKKSRFANTTGRVSTANGLHGYIGAPA